MTRLALTLAFVSAACAATPSARTHRLEPSGVLEGEWRQSGRRGFELWLQHTRDGSVLWAQAVPMPESLLDTSPEVLARGYVENLAGWGARLHPSRGFAQSIFATRWQTRLVDESPVSVAGAPGHTVLVDVAGPRLGLGAGARTARAAVVLLRGPSFVVQRAGDRDREWPSLLIVGYAAPPSSFDPELDALGTLLDSLTFATEDDS